MSKYWRIRERLVNEGESFDLEPRTRNASKIRGRRLKTVPEEPAAKRGTWKWVAKIPRKFKFIDDGTLVSKVNMVATLDEVRVMEGRELRFKRDIQTENIMNRTFARARSQGMKSM